jgi:hypothetical protein
MSAAAMETSAKSRRSRPQDKSDDPTGTASLVLPDDAVAELVRGYVRTVTILLPTAALRPTEAVDAAFDLAEQLLTLTRQTVHEAVSMVESGLDSLDSLDKAA